MSFFDSHCHFDDQVFDKQHDQLWRQCQALDLRHLVIPGTHVSQWQSALELTQRFQGIYMAAGLHPWWIEQAVDKQDWSEQLSTYLSQSCCVAIGECGLDATINVDLSIQKIIFEQHIELAITYSKPLIAHVHRSHNDTFRLLKKYQPPAGGVIHGFTGSFQQATNYWGLGFSIGVGGSITYPRANKTRQAIMQMPLESLVLETDAPYMPLSGGQGLPNSPLNLLNVFSQLLALRHEDSEVIERALEENTLRLFKV